MCTGRIVPNGIKRDFRRNLLAIGEDGFLELLREVERNMRPMLSRAQAAAPRLRVVQRHYLTQRSEPTNDALLEFDLRTVANHQKRQSDTRIKAQPQWAEAAFQAWSEKRSNMQLEIGAHFHYRTCPAIHKPTALALVRDTWLACQPFLDTLLAR